MKKDFCVKMFSQLKLFRVSLERNKCSLEN